MRVHYRGELEVELKGVLVEAAGDGVTVSFGDEVPVGTEVLLQGVVSGEELDRLPDLKAVVVPWTGLPGQTAKTLSERPEVACYNLHHNAASTAETGLALLMAAARQLVPLDSGMRDGKWGDRFGDRRAVKLEGHKMCVLGLGAIGRRMAGYGLAMDMDVHAVRRSGPFGLQNGVWVHSMDDLDKALTGTRALVCALPLTPETRGLIGARELELLDRFAIVVNVGRGASFDEKALFEACQSGRLQGAGIDVWWNYPKTSDEICAPGDLPWHELETVVMSPHVGGGNRENEPERMAALGDLLRGLAAGREMAGNRVDVGRGY